MTLEQTQKNAIYIAAAAALGAVLTSGELPLPFAAISGAAFFASYFVAERTAGKGTLLWNVAAVAMLVYLGIAFATSTMDIVLAASMFAVFLLINRLYNRRTGREHAQLHLTMLMAISGGAILSADLSFGVAFLVFCVAITWSLTLSLLRVEIEEEARANHVADGGLSVLQSHRLVSARFLGLLGGLALTAVAAAVFVFVLFPRVSFGIWSRKGVGGDAHTGYTGQVALGGSGLIKDDPRVAMRVFTAKDSGDSLGLYWRGATMDQYDGRAWSDTTPVAQQDSPGLDHAFGAPADKPVALTTMTVELVPGGNNTIFTTGHTRRIMFEQRRSLNQQQIHLQSNESGDLQYKPSQTTEFRYRITTELEGIERFRGLGRDYPEHFEKFRHMLVPKDQPKQPTDFERYTQLPPNLNPRILELGKRLVGDRDPSEAVRSVVQYLATYAYSLQITASGDDPLSSFLFDVKSGHCEYFATALAVLLRAGGIPTRMVMGYYGGKSVSDRSYYAVLEGDAHDWVEVYFPGKGWHTFDATPAAGREATVNAVYAALLLRIDQLRTQWRNTVVEYDLGTQFRAFQGLMRAANELSARLSSGSKVPALQHAGRILLVIFGVGLTIAGLIFGASRRFGLPMSAAQKATRERLLASELFHDLTVRLSRRGIERRPSQTPAEIVSEVRQRMPQQAPTVEHVVDRYVAARYGMQPIDVAEAQELRREIRRV